MFILYMKEKVLQQFECCSPKIEISFLGYILMTLIAWLTKKIKEKLWFFFFLPTETLRSWEI